MFRAKSTLAGELIDEKDHGRGSELDPLESLRSRKSGIQNPGETIEGSGPHEANNLKKQSKKSDAHNSERGGKKAESQAHDAKRRIVEKRRFISIVMLWE